MRSTMEGGLSEAGAAGKATCRNATLFRTRQPPLLAIASLCLLLGSVSGAAFAARPSDAETDRARQAVLRGDELMDKGSYEDALARYRSAHQIMGVPSTGMAVARALAKVGRLREARQAAESVRDMKVEPSEPEPYRRARQQALSLIEELSARIPVVRVEVTGASPGSAVRIQLDGADVSAGSAEAGIPLDTGVHSLVVTAPGHKGASESFTLVEGERRRVPMRLVHPKRVESRAVPKTLMYTGFGIGAAGVVVGSITGLVALSKAGNVKDKCVDNLCPPETRNEADSSKAFGRVSNVSFAVGLAGAALGTIGWVLYRSSDSREQAASGAEVTASVQPGGMALVGRF
jgi:hypothetical protein